VTWGKRHWRYRHLVRRNGTRWPKGQDGRTLLRKLNKVGRRTGLRIRITSGLRNNYEQWVAYMDHLRGGTLAAPCCARKYIHPWEECLRQCRSNHCVSRAADVVVKHPGDSSWVNIGNNARARAEMRALGLCLPVPGEPWHVEVGSTWRV